MRGEYWVRGALFSYVDVEARIRGETSAASDAAHDQ
jgi:hypothetical protein